MVDYTCGKLTDKYSPCVETSNLNVAAIKAAAYEHQTTKKFAYSANRRGTIKMTAGN
jgi:hypothetical protein